MYLKYKSLRDLLSRQDLSLSQKRRALRRLPFDTFAHDYLLRMNMMKVASSANETAKGTKVELGAFLHLVHKYREHKRVLRNELVRKDNEAFGAMMDKKAAAVGMHDAALAAARQPYSVWKKVLRRTRPNDAMAAGSGAAMPVDSNMKSKDESTEKGEAPGA